MKWRRAIAVIYAKHIQMTSVQSRADLDASMMAGVAKAKMAVIVRTTAYENPVAVALALTGKSSWLQIL